MQIDVGGKKDHEDRLDSEESAGAGAAAKRGSRYAWGAGCAATGPGRGFSQGPGEKNGHPLFPRMDLLKTAVPLQPAGRFPDAPVSTS